MIIKTSHYKNIFFQNKKETFIYNSKNVRLCKEIEDKYENNFRFTNYIFSRLIQISDSILFSEFIIIIIIIIMLTVTKVMNNYL